MKGNELGIRCTEISLKAWRQSKHLPDFYEQDSRVKTHSHGWLMLYIYQQDSANGEVVHAEDPAIKKKD
jgi:hypothetical protein